VLQHLGVVDNELQAKEDSLAHAHRIVTNASYAKTMLEKTVDVCKDAAWAHAVKHGAISAVDLMQMATPPNGVTQEVWDKVRDDTSQYGLPSMIENAAISLHDIVDHSAADLLKMVDGVRPRDINRGAVADQLSKLKKQVEENKRDISVLSLIADIAEAVMGGMREAHGVKIVLRGTPMTDLATRNVVVA